MGDYTPVFAPGMDVTLTASADITGGQLVIVSGANTVAPASAAASNWLGVARQDAKNGERVVVTRGGVQSLTASGAITAGARVIPAANGRVVTIGAGNEDHAVGIALTTAADAAKVRVAMDR